MPNLPVTADEQLKTLTYAILKLEAELRLIGDKEHREAIMEVVQVLKEMRVAIIAKEGTRLSP